MLTLNCGRSRGGKSGTRHYSCFDHFGRSTETYGWAAGFGMAPTCEGQVVRELIALRRKSMEYLQRDGQVAADAYFCAEQNALIVRDAEQYYRTMFRRDHSSWNQRDTHMMRSLMALTDHLNKQRSPAKIIVWAHNSHLGDARATQMSERGELNLGQLVREYYEHQAVLIGFTTHSGTVTAASDWDGPAERKNVRPSLPGSYERLFHEVEHVRFWLDFKKHPKVKALLRTQPWSELSASFTDPTPNEPVTTSLRFSPISSTPCCISIILGRSNRWSATPNGRSEKSKRPFRQGSDHSRKTNLGR